MKKLLKKLNKLIIDSSKLNGTNSISGVIYPTVPLKALNGNFDLNIGFVSSPISVCGLYLPLYSIPKLI